MTEQATAKRNYKATLNLPKDVFAMKANLSQNEPLSMKRWEQAKLYDAVIESRDESHAPAFIFHDGPPYANASLHIGHLLNKVLKDIVVRSHLMAGQQCRFIPGWDCHGLPIEHRVMTDLIKAGKGDKLNSLTEDQRRMVVRRECAAYAEKSIKLQAGQLKRMLTLADYEHPYLTMKPEYESGVLNAFADLVEKGLVYRALKPVHWSIENQTALAEAELEYEDREDLSIYVNFEAVDRGKVSRAFGGIALHQNPSFMIWTTTPWTLPANLAIAVHEKFRYSLVKVDGNVTVIASALMQKVTHSAKAKSVQVLAETDGKNLVGLRYRHPFVDPMRGEGAAYWLRDQHGRPLRTEQDLLNIYVVVAADYVTLEDGTGLVHTAPGHGTDDYQTGLRERLPIYSPVKSDGTFDETAPAWLCGLSVWKANEVIADRLCESHHLFYSHKFTHSYPHDWRGKSPVIFRATEQWFIHVNRPLKSHGWTLIEMALASIDGLGPAYHRMNLRAKQGDPDPDYTILARLLRDPAVRSKQPEVSRYLSHSDSKPKAVEFIPSWGRNRLRGMLDSRPDWCISRQRAWGLPIPAFYGPVSAGGHVEGSPDHANQALMLDQQILLTAESIRAVARVFHEKGSDAWFECDDSELLKYYDANADPDPSADWYRKHYCGPNPFKTPLRKSKDIFDVWFESGSSWNAVLRQRDLGYPADLYLEGSDQHRGWFQLSLLPALGVTGQSPFKSLLTHGFMVDKDGKKMSKSLGNALDVDELLKTFGADVCRWWVSSLAFENDIKVDLEYFETAGESYRKVRNTLRFLLSNLYDFNPTNDRVKPGAISPASIDGFILQEAGKLQEFVTDAYEQYEFRKAHLAIFDFCNDTLSAFYCAAVKDRLYCDRADSTRRRTTQTVMWDLSEMLCRLLAPLIPHSADEGYRALWKGDDSRTVHVQTHGDVPLDFTADADWPRVLQAREAAQKALEEAKSRGIENPLDAEVVLPDVDSVLAKFKADLPDMLGVSRVKLDRAASSVMINDLRNEPRCERSWKRDGTVRQRADGGVLCDRCAEAVGV